MGHAERNGCARVCLGNTTKYYLQVQMESSWMMGCRRKAKRRRMYPYLGR